MADKVIETQDRMVRGTDLLDRKAEPPIKGEAAFHESMEAIKGKRPRNAAARLADIEAALVKAKTLPPDGGARCDDCWRRGRDAVLKLLADIETEESAA